MIEGEPLSGLGMTAEQLAAYLEELLQEEAAEAAEARGTSVEAEIDSPGFAAVRSSASYAVSLIVANNVFLARQLIDLGVLQPGSDTVGGDGNERE